VYSPMGPSFAAPPPGAVASFQGIVRGTYGVACTVRQEKGQDIAGE
jgi:adenine C2-methylase RlmN of 23S rRNA A2503 and tRNA A37